jgi:hypothetical protein
VPGHEGTMCWYAGARPSGSAHRPRASDLHEKPGRSRTGCGTDRDLALLPHAALWNENNPGRLIEMIHWIGLP